MRPIQSRIFIFGGVFMALLHPVSANTYTLESPDHQIRLQVEVPASGSQETPSWSAAFHGKTIMKGCRLNIEAVGEGNLLAGAQVIANQARSSNRQISVRFGRSSTARDSFRELRLQMEQGRERRTTLVFRCYDDAIAFRYEVPKQKGIEKLVIADEKTSFGITENPNAFLQYLENFKTSHEHNVIAVPLNRANPDTLLDTPTTFVRTDGIHIAITEASLRHYPGMALMHLSSDTENSLTSQLSPRPDGTKAVCPLPMETPWRVVLVGERAGSLLESNTLYCLNTPSVIGDSRWIKPGKMTWAWWNGNVVKEGKPEPPIFSMEAQRLYIDFCAKNGIDFHSVIADNTDTPWYFQTQKGVAPGPDTDVTRVRPDLDLPAIRRYAESKGVRLWTWVHQAALRGRVEEAFAAFEKFGWSGMMVDFFDHDDQETVEHAEAILQAAARHHILIHFHGIWKPTGWQRTYPNLMNHEGALNLEYLKWSDRCTPEHTLNMMFTRMVAGPMDYHSGGFRAVRPDAFSIKFASPNVMGTRCFQLGSYVCFDNPNPMLADYPGAYEGQPGFDFLSRVPTWWDETRVLIADVGKVLVTARRKGTRWYVGGMTAKQRCKLEIPLSFLGGELYSGILWKDSPESDADPNRLQKETFTAKSSDVLSVDIAVDGGFVMEFTPK